MSDLYSELLVKKKQTAKDMVVKYGLIVLTVIMAIGGLLVNGLLLVPAVALGVACYFVIPKTQRICTKTLVERLYSQVSALINHRNGIGDIRPVVAQGGGRDFNTVQFAKVEICLL